MEWLWKPEGLIVGRGSNTDFTQWNANQFMHHIVHLGNPHAVLLSASMGEGSPGANTSLCRFAFCCRVFAHDATDLWERRWLQRPCGLCDCCVSTEGSHVCHRTRRPLHHQAYRWQNHPSHCYNDCSCRRPGKLASSSQSLQPTVNELHII